MNIEEFEKTEAYKETQTHAIESLRTAILTGNKDAAIPPNCHIAFGLLSSSQLVPTAARIMMSLSAYFYDNPDKAAEIWEVIKDDVYSGVQHRG